MSRKRDEAARLVGVSETGDAGREVRVTSDGSGTFVSPNPVKPLVLLYKDGPNDQNGVEIPGGPLSVTEAEMARDLGLPHIIAERTRQLCMA